MINVATGGRISLNTLFNDDSAASSMPASIRSTARRVQGDVKDSQADISKARRILGYEPSVSFEEGLARTVAWYRDSHVTVA